MPSTAKKYFQLLNEYDFCHCHFFNYVGYSNFIEFTKILAKHDLRDPIQKKRPTKHDFIISNGVFRE